MLHQLSRSRLDLLFLTLRSDQSGLWVVYSPSFFLRQVEAAILTWNARPQMKLVEREAAHARRSEVCTPSLVMVDCSSRSSELYDAAII